MLTFMKFQTEEGVLKTVTRDIYRMINKEPLGSQPVSIYPSLQSNGMVKVQV